jgi:hypothetical protein
VIDSAGNLLSALPILISLTSLDRWMGEATEVIQKKVPVLAKLGLKNRVRERNPLYPEVIEHW